MKAKNQPLANFAEISTRDRLLNKSQVADMLGISTRTLDRLVKAGLLEKVFVGASPRFRASDIAHVMENGI